MLLGVICCCQEGRDQDQGLEAEKRPGHRWPGNGSPRHGTRAEAVEARRVKEEVGAGEEASPCWTAPWHPSLGLSPSEPPPALRQDSGSQPRAAAGSADAGPARMCRAQGRILFLALATTSPWPTPIPGKQQVKESS